MDAIPAFLLHRESEHNADQTSIPLSVRTEYERFLVRFLLQRTFVTTSLFPCETSLMLFLQIQRRLRCLHH
jgi:hypothetical protein